jgi:hypothetical protein
VTKDDTSCSYRLCCEYSCTSDTTTSTYTPPG